MKKIFTLAIALTAFILSSYGQCVPDSADLSQGQLLYPNSLPGILQGSVYSGVLSFLVPDSLPGRDFGNPVVAPFTITIDSIQITSVTGTPNGISAGTTPTLGTWLYANGASCILFSGTTTDPIGNYPLTVSGVGCGHFTIPFIGTRVDSCMPFNFSQVYPYDLQVCSVQCTNTYDTTYVNICRGDTLHWGSNTVTRGGRYVDTVLQSIGCDSLRLLFVTRFNPGLGRDSVIGCGSAMFNGISYTSDTVIPVVYPGASANGCDSTTRYVIIVGGQTPSITTSSTALTAVDQAAVSYQWLQNGSAVSGATSASYSPTGSTVNSYSVVVTDVYGCVDTSAGVMVSGITGIAEPNVKLYPNPNSGSFVMETHSVKGSIYTITNALGQTVLQNDISSDRQVIDMDNATPGIYTISIKGMDRIQFTVTK